MNRKILYKGGSFFVVTSFWNYDETGNSWQESDYQEVGENQIHFETFHELSENEENMLTLNGYEIYIELDNRSLSTYLEEPIKKLISIAYDGNSLCSFVKLPSESSIDYVIVSDFLDEQKFLSFDSLFQKIESLKIKNLLLDHRADIRQIVFKIINTEELNKQLIIDLDRGEKKIKGKNQDCLSERLHTCRDGVIRITGIKDLNLLKRIIRNEDVSKFEIISISTISFVFEGEGDYFIKIKYIGEEDRFELYHDGSIVVENELLKKKLIQELLFADLTLQDINCYENALELKFSDIFPRQEYIQKRIFNIEEELRELLFFPIVSDPIYELPSNSDAINKLRLELDELKKLESDK